MTKKERVLCVIDHKITDKLPKGELGIAKEIANGILGRAYSDKKSENAVREKLNMDLKSEGMKMVILFTEMPTVITIQ